MSWLLAHFIGDYLLQTDDMAANKKTSSLWCAWHVLCYMLPFLLCGLADWQLALIAWQHYTQDRTGFIVWLMRVKGSEQFARPPMAPWSIIVMDNIVHCTYIAFVVWAGSAIRSSI